MKFVYIMSSPRGGSTILSLVLGNHTAVANLGEVSFIPKLLAMGELCTCQEKLSVCETWGQIFKKLESTTGVDMRSSPYGLFLGDAIKKGAGGGLVDHQYQTARRLLLARYRGVVDTIAVDSKIGNRSDRFAPNSIKEGAKNTIKLYEAASKQLKKDVIVDASKFSRKAIHLYLADPDRVRIIHLVRDVRGVVASRRTVMGVEKPAHKWKNYHQRTMGRLDRWVDPEHRMFMRYEDFANDPKHYLNSICKWLEIPYTASMLKFDTNLKTHSAGGNPTRFDLTEGIRPADERWRTILSDREREGIEKISGKVNRAYGYV